MHLPLDPDCLISPKEFRRAKFRSPTACRTSSVSTLFPCRNNAASMPNAEGASPPLAWTRTVPQRYDADGSAPPCCPAQIPRAEALLAGYETPPAYPYGWGTVSVLQGSVEPP